MTSEEASADCREKLAAMMLRLSIATGHGDTFDDLLAELEAVLRQKKIPAGADRATGRQSVA